MGCPTNLPVPYSMLSDFIKSDSVTLQTLTASTEVEIEGADVELGPLAELLIFRRKSMSADVLIKMRNMGSLGNAFRSASSGGGWVYGSAPGAGVLRFQHGKPQDSEEDVKHQFLLGMLQGVRAAAMPEQSAKALAGAAGELIDNVEQHAGSGQDALAAFQVHPGSLWLAIGDAGQGMLSTYRQFEDVSSTQDALRAAVIEHRSSTRDPERGQGFRKLMRALRSLDASLRVRTGDASLELEGMADSSQWILREQVQLVGCVISAHLRW